MTDRDNNLMMNYIIISIPFKLADASPLAEVGGIEDRRDATADESSSANGVMPSR